MIIEPFAGAAGYSCRHASLGRDVILNDLDPDVVALWRRLQTMTSDDLDAIEATLSDERTTEILIASCGGGSAWKPTVEGKSQKITPRMRNDGGARGGWPNVRKRIERVMPYFGGWEICQGSYLDLPDIEATWFIDPPYQPLISVAGNEYTHGAGGIDFAELGEWCKSRKGQVIVCEQSPAQWLPFTHLAHQNSGANNSQSRSEVVWLSEQQQGQLFTDATKAAAA
jgi:site-specific DNA-adenine methylase